MKSLKKEIINSLLSIKKIHAENNQLNYNVLFELLNNHDEEIINLLLNNKQLKTSANFTHKCSQFLLRNLVKLFHLIV